MYKGNQKHNLLTMLFAAAVAVVVLAFVFAPTGFALADNLTDPDIPQSLRDENLWYIGDDNDFQIDVAKIRASIASWGLPDASTLEPVKIAVVDTGINLDHPLFNKVLYKATKIAEDNGTPIPPAEQQEPQPIGYNCVGNNSAVADTSNDYHGTHVAGIIASLILELGLENYIKIVPVRAIDANKQFTVPNVVEAIDWACGNNNAQTTLGKPLVCDVVNLSLGILSGDISSGSSWNNRTALQNAFDTHGATTVFVASAGNNSSDSADKPFYPAAMGGVVSVMSYNTTGGLFTTSNYGDYDLVAPGQNIVGASSGSTYVEKNGTSMAAAFVSLGGALLKLRYKAQSQIDQFGGVPTPRQIGKMLRNHAERTIEKQGIKMVYRLKVLDLEILAEADFSAAQYDIGFADPTRVISTPAEGSNFLQYMATREEVNFSASILPAGEYNPQLESQIVWRIEKVSLDGSVETISAGEGLNFTFPKNMTGGKYNVYCVLNYMGRLLESEKTEIVIRYNFPDFSQIRIAPINKIQSYNGNGAELPSYTGYTSVLSLTGIEFIDQSIEITWYVNGELAGSGTVFYFTPISAGVHQITAYYGAHQVYFTFELETKKPPFYHYLLAGLAVFIGGLYAAYLIIDLRPRAVKSENIEFAPIFAINEFFRKLDIKLDKKHNDQDEQ
jgi:subtilisin family serine protease